MIKSNVDTRTFHFLHLEFVLNMGFNNMVEHQHSKGKRGIEHKDHTTYKKKKTVLNAILKRGPILLTVLRKYLGVRLLARKKALKVLDFKHVSTRQKLLIKIYCYNL